MLTVRKVLAQIVNQLSMFWLDIKENPFKCLLFIVLLLIALNQLPFIFSETSTTLINDFGMIVYTLIIFSVYLASKKGLADSKCTKVESQSRKSDYFYLLGLSIVFVLSIKFMF
jgi:hypothetical protein